MQIVALSFTIDSFEPHRALTYKKNQDHGALVDVICINTGSLSKPAPREHQTEQTKTNEIL